MSTPTCSRIDAAALADEFMDHLDSAPDRGPLGGIPTGHAELDLLLGGLRPGHLYVLTGYPGVGTSTFALGLARQSAIRHGLATLLLSPATPRLEVTYRLIAAEGRIGLHLLRSGRLTDEDWARTATTLGELSAVPLYVDDGPDVDINELPATAPGDAGQPWGLIVIDGASLLTRTTAPEHLWAAHTKFAQDAKRLAQRLHVPVVATASAGRQISRRVGFIPQIGDVAASAAYEAEADVVIGISRPDMFDRESPRAGEADLIVMKSRSSPCWSMTVAFQGHYARFADMKQPTPADGGAPGV